MKLKILIGITMLFLFSCNKDDNYINNTFKHENMKPVLKAGATRRLVRDFHGTHDTYTWECYIPGNNCFEPATVTPKLSNLIDLIVYEENQMDFFERNNYSEVFDIDTFDQDIQDGLENGNLHTVIKRKGTCLVYLIIIDPIYTSDIEIEMNAIFVLPIRLC